jgi:hypothetical protein
MNENDLLFGIAFWFKFQLATLGFITGVLALYITAKIEKPLISISFSVFTVFMVVCIFLGHPFVMFPLFYLIGIVILLALGLIFYNYKGK